MQTLELVSDEDKPILIEAAEENGQLSEEQERLLETFYRGSKSRMLNFYDLSRLRTQYFSDRQEAANYWQEETHWFEHRLSLIETTHSRFQSAGIQPPPALIDAITTLKEIVEACRGAYELLA
jgi:hypothetical protein